MALKERELILIPCSVTKNHGGRRNINGRRLEDDLPEDMKGELDTMRSYVGDKLLDISSQDLRKEPHLPAFQRYSGKMYERIHEGVWDEVRRRRDMDIVVLSALYGMVYWDEPVINYDLAMNQSIYPRFMLNTWWRHEGLPEILSSYVETGGYSMVRSFLSGDYLKAVLPAMDRSEALWLQYEYSGLGVGSNYYRGTDLSHVILDRNTGCPECGSRAVRRVSREYHSCLSCGVSYAF